MVAQPLAESERVVSLLAPRAAYARVPDAPAAAAVQSDGPASCARAGRNASLARAVRVLQIVQWSVSCAVILSWLVTGSWVLNNVLGVAICVTCTAVIEIPNLRMCCTLLGLLFVYDFFWVFLSEGCVSPPPPRPGTRPAGARG